MTAETTDTQRGRSRPARIALTVTGAVTGLAAVALLAVGGVALWGDSEKDADGYLSTDSHRFEASTHALVSESLDVDLDGAEWLMDTEDFGEVRLNVAPRTDEPLFVGIAPTDQVSHYLRGVAHTSVTELDYWPFNASYVDRAGDRRPAAPGEQSIWAASTEGAGPQMLEWDVQDGDWSVVVMNADGSPGVDAGISAGGKIPFLSELGWSAIGTGAVFLIATAGLLVLGIRRPRNRPGAEAGVAPAAA
jgi:hypothetical protein